MSFVPLILTMDLEIAHDHNIFDQKYILAKLKTDFYSGKIPLTIFSTLEALEFFNEELRDFSKEGYELGCHGINHNISENYKIMSATDILQNIKVFNDRYSLLFNKYPGCFRGPFMSTSSSLQKVLIEFGYKADFSVCSQRFDFFISKGGDIRWLTAPRLPYRPDMHNPYKKGTMPLWVIPLSSALFPFISGTMYILGINFMKTFFRVLLSESIRTSKPIVYMFHSYEFAEYKGNLMTDNKKSKVRKDSLPIHQKLYIKDKFKRYNINYEFIKYMLSFDFVKPLTGSQFLDYLGGA
ncbi:MAG: polysaccharide deacetylase family protein [Ignavibacteria bacterium]|jgi:peptidoglycan/xylan/chitin deacetylase (PgdA/CDA1 family)|nr:polysaccharide deacetylase family protein [Ignavibacteria bacterium]